MAAAKDLESRAQHGTQGRRPPAVRKWHHCLKFYAIKGKKKWGKKKKRKPNHLKFSRQHLLPNFFFFFEETNQPEADEANMKVAAESALRADGSLLGFSFS